MRFKYTIGESDRELLNFEDSRLINLQDFINFYCAKLESVNSVILELKDLKDNLNNLDILADTVYNGYWEDEELGQSLLLWGHDYGTDVFINKSDIYIENDHFPSTSRISFTIDNFIEILEEWREVLKTI